MSDLARYFANELLYHCANAKRAQAIWRDVRKWGLSDAVSRKVRMGDLNA